MMFYLYSVIICYSIAMHIKFKLDIYITYQVFDVRPGFVSSGRPGLSSAKHNIFKLEQLLISFTYIKNKVSGLN